MTRRLGVCSWSLEPKGPRDLAEKCAAVGVRWTQLALDPLRTGAWGVEETVSALRSAGVGIASGMMGTKGEDYSTLETIRTTGGVRPTEHWAENRAAAEANAELAQRLRLSLVTFHAGFLPHDRSDPERSVLLARLAEIVDLFAARGVRVGFETGQESAATLLEALADLRRPAAGVNFDPANMILYGMGEPLEAFDRLAPHIVQIHVKDALPAARAGEWGAEVPVGTGRARWSELARRIAGRLPQIDLMIEREAGTQRIADICTARELVERESAA